jgi:hypothetical protein
MKYEKLSLLLLALLLPACGLASFFKSSCNDGRDIAGAAKIHEEKLRRHFTYGSIGVDVSTLIAETRRISAQLKYSGNIKDANRFDSYIDVLMFGNRTVDESLHDVMRLVSGGGGVVGRYKTRGGRSDGGWCEHVASALDKIFGW